MSMIGKTLGHYTVSTLIGRGGMGEVYQAKDQKLGRDVAIKVLPDEFAKDFISISILEGKSKGGKLERESGKSQLDSGQAAI